VKRSIRTNNPGALNISAWQRSFPGFVGETQPDGAGNRTTIYVTPEHGIAAWYHLLTNRYGFGENGSFVLRDLARRYAGVPSHTHPAAQSYIAGWRRRSGNVLSGTSQIRLDDDDDMVLLGKGMFGHEIGAASPLQDGQITNALALKRSGTLPAA
jgi:D-alanyl-D-alanine carboxypeptidase